MQLHWTLVVLLFFSPDLGAIGYLWNNTAGAVLYNLLHHKFVAILLICAGYLLGENWWMGIGLLFFAHRALTGPWGMDSNFPFPRGKRTLDISGKKSTKTRR